MIAIENGLGKRELLVQGSQTLLPAAFWYENAQVTDADSLLVFLHGGNFLARSNDRLDQFYQELSTAIPSLAMLAPNYTLASESPFPTPLEDIYSVLAWAQAHKRDLGWNGKHLIIAGIEAGANLAAAAALVARDRHGPNIAGQILLMPMLDPALTSQSMRESCATVGQVFAADQCASGFQGYLPNLADRVHPYATPLYSSRLKELPPTLIFSADEDPLRDEAEAYAVKLIANGVRTTVVRLPAIPLESHGARGSCTSSGKVICEISSFLSTLFI